jgi:DNA-binding transcriptional regulator YiaG
MTTRPAAMTPAEFRQVLERAGLTQGEAARRLGVGRATVCRWLAGTTPIARTARIAIREIVRARRS